MPMTGEKTSSNGGAANREGGETSCLNKRSNLGSHLCFLSSESLRYLFLLLLGFLLA